MGNKLPRYCHEDVDRHGNVRLYFKRPGGRKFRIYPMPGTPSFWEAYRAACEGVATAKVIKSADMVQAPAGTLGWLVSLYFAQCFEYRQLDDSTRRVRRRIIETCLQEPTAPDAPTLMRGCPLARLSVEHIEMLRDRKSESPEAANSRVKAFRALLKWAVVKRHVSINSARDVALMRNASEGHHTWTIAEVRQFETHWPIGTKARLALALFAFLGQRKGDTIAFGRQHVRNGWIHFTQGKNRRRKPVTLDLPILPALQAVIDASSCGDLTFLVTDYGKSFTANGFGNRMRDWCDKAGLPHCSAHGLRKAGATIAAENGATEAQLNAIYGWTDPDMAAHYTKKARQKHLAQGAMHLLIPGPEGEQDIPTSARVAGKWEQKGRKAQ